jgi:hypothetical protein
VVIFRDVLVFGLVVLVVGFFVIFTFGLVVVVDFLVVLVDDFLILEVDGDFKLYDFDLVVVVVLDLV